LKALRGKLKPDRVVGAIQSREQEVISPLLLARQQTRFFPLFFPLSVVEPKGGTDEKM